MSIHQQATLPADPDSVSEVLADAEALSALSGMGGTAGRSAAEEVCAFDGHVTGRQIELVPGRRIVQAWRFPVWDAGGVPIRQLVRSRHASRLVAPGIRQHRWLSRWHSWPRRNRQGGASRATSAGRPRGAGAA